MRQGQQNRRGRGRNNNRKGQNPLTRSYESNGPEVKIRGTPAHVAEKYMSLARDAMASGDRVLAENFFQHAEHYNRIIMAYRDQQMGQTGDATSGRGRSNAQDDQSDQSYDDDGDDRDNGNFDTTQVPGAEPQPSTRAFDDQPKSDSDGGHSNRNAGERRPGGRGRNNTERRGRNGTRGGNRQNAGEGGQQAARDNGNKGQSSREEADTAGSAPAPSGRFADSEDKPDFLSRPVAVPVRRTRRSPRTAEAAPADTPVTTDEN
ncbi:MAG: DUF4167 domain-containing protein [Pseudomonadota bacterium]